MSIHFLSIFTSAQYSPPCEQEGRAFIAVPFAVESGQDAIDAIMTAVPSLCSVDQQLTLNHVFECIGPSGNPLVHGKWLIDRHVRKGPPPLVPGDMNFTRPLFETVLFDCGDLPVNCWFGTTKLDVDKKILSSKIQVTFQGFAEYLQRLPQKGGSRTPEHFSFYFQDSPFSLGVLDEHSNDFLTPIINNLLVARGAPTEDVDYVLELFQHYVQGIKKDNEQLINSDHFMHTLLSGVMTEENMISDNWVEG